MIIEDNLSIVSWIGAPEQIIGQKKARLDVLDGLEGIVALHDLNVLSHRTRNAFFPRQLMVRDVMTPDPESVTAGTQLNDAARLLLSAIFTGLPVVDKQCRPVGVITQGDLIRKGGLPLRLGLLSESDQNPINQPEAGHGAETQIKIIVKIIFPGLN